MFRLTQSARILAKARCAGAKGITRGAPLAAAQSSAYSIVMRESQMGAPFSMIVGTRPSGFASNSLLHATRLRGFGNPHHRRFWGRHHQPTEFPAKDARTWLALRCECQVEN